MQGDGAAVKESRVEDTEDDAAERVSFLERLKKFHESKGKKKLR